MRLINSKGRGSILLDIPRNGLAKGADWDFIGMSEMRAIADGGAFQFVENMSFHTDNQVSNDVTVGIGEMVHGAAAPDNALVEGDGGDNTLVDTSGDDTINAFGGNDSITVTGGFDTVDGGTERDRLTINYTAATQGIFNNMALTGSLATGYSGGFSQGNNSLRVNFAGIEDFTIITANIDEDENITTGDGDDFVTVYHGYDIFNAGLGNDTLIVQWGAALGDIIEQGYGGYAKTYGSGDRRVHTNGVDNFHITTGSGNDSFSTGDGNDIVNLGSGDDFVNLFAGNDIANGGDGIDGFSANFAARATAINVNFQTGFSNVFTNFEYIGTVTGSAFADTIVTSNVVRNEIFVAGDGDDNFTTVNGQDIFEAGAGTDTLTIDWSASTNDAYNQNYGGYEKTFLSASRVIWTNGVERYNVTTGSGNDSFTTGNYDDIVVLGSGNDFVDLMKGNDIADGGIGDDGFSADFSERGSGVSFNLQNGTSATNLFTSFEFIGYVTGTAFADTIVTSALLRNEIFVAGDGDDSFTTVNGNDIFDGGLGTDTLIIDWGSLTGDVSDPSYGGYAKTFSGGGRLIQTNGVERFNITTGSGNDAFTTGNDNDVVSLGAGNDFVNLMKGNDTADGGLGDDGFSADFSERGSGVSFNLQTGTSPGNAFTNFEFIGTVIGTGFSDTVVTSALVRDELFIGGEGDDNFTTVNGQDVFEAGGGTDTLTIDWSSLVTAANDVGYGGYSRSFGGGGRLIRTNGVEKFNITTGSGNDVISGGASDDIINLGSGDDFVNLFGGNDTANGGDGIDGFSADFSASSSGVTFNLQTGASPGNAFTNFEWIGDVTGTAFSDTIVTGSIVRNENFYGGDGDDSFTTVDGQDIFDGGIGNDTLIIDWSTLANDAGNTGYGGFAYSFVGGARLMRVNGVEQFNITTGSGNDNITTGAGDDILDGGAGNDLLNGAGGTDTISYRSATSGVTVSLALQSAAQNTIGAGIDTLFGFENLSGSGFNDTLTGSSIANAIYGGAGNDTVNGSWDDLVLDGGADYDTLGLSGTGTLSATISGFEALALGGGAITMSSSQLYSGFGTIAPYTPSLALSGTGSLIINLGAMDTEFYLTQVTDGAGVNVTVNGSTIDDVIKGVINSVNVINGGDGWDFLRGGLLGDTINGGDGNDKITGYGGADILTGGAGIDQFRLLGQGDSGTGSGADQITDFVIGTDVLDFRLFDIDPLTAGVQNPGFSFIGSNTFSHSNSPEIRFGVNGSDLLVQVDVDGDGSANMEIVLQGLGAQTLTATDFWF